MLEVKFGRTYVVCGFPENSLSWWVSGPRYLRSVSDFQGPGLYGRKGKRVTPFSERLTE